MKKAKNIITLLVLVSLVLVGCTSGASSDTIKVGSKDFTESLIVSEIYALALEENGYSVERVPNIASSVIPQAIENAEIDLYPEYTGTALLSIFNLPMDTDPDSVAETIRNAYEEGGELTTLEYAPANDSQGIAITTAASEEYGIDTISDLQANAENIRFASQGEFEEREDGLGGLEEVYGEFNFESITVYDNSLKYQVLSSDEADATPAYTTEGQLSNTDMYKVLEDDQNFWPPYNLVPIIRQDILEANPDIKTIINDINATLDTQSVVDLNASVDIDGRDYMEVAEEYYNSIQ
ncbi:glycine/betaine ABC transporter substrate-binding protein [Ruoffia tabacinasalis]|uniref:Glycine/betaine ABC transporter substrate-binding protein n=1 Tax=Ruoffia tabacinasalis TaxID=87458 RepID=A0A5R9DWU0_9LACT|nr:glycine betaine ABC transporter substrate-binding protein [Ruoffia tabacinasalis]TLQ41021.1 glycine/betaine ABC transporter substrate-binding protein [Ruoffia tabacinasalis]